VVGWTVVTAAVLLLIVVPFLLFEERLSAVAAAAVAHPGAAALTAALLAGLLAADVLLPVPSSLVSTACGSLFGPGAGTLVSWAGMTGGAVLGYALGAGLGTRALAATVGDAQAARAAELIARHGSWGLVVCRGVPVLAEASVLLAGTARMPVARFAAAVALSNLGLSAAYAVTGAAAAGRGSFLLALAGAVGVPALAHLLVRRRRRP
jgi:uncharacterized membrane protein YdjX (TVP38/TMEM64 family)